MFLKVFHAKLIFKGLEKSTFCPHDYTSPYSTKCPATDMVSYFRQLNDFLCHLKEIALA
jgi:hypothetical protein